MAGNLVQGAVFTVMVVRAGLLRDPAFEAGVGRADRPQPAVFSERAGGARPQDASRFRRAAEFGRGQTDFCATHAGPGRRAERLAAQLEAAAAGRARQLRPECDPSGPPRAAQPRRRSPRAAGPTAAAAPAAAARRRPERRRPARHPAGALGHADLCPRHRSHRDRAGQPRRRAHRRRQHPCLWPTARPRAWPGRAATPARESFAAGSKPSWSASPAAISSASSCRRSSADWRCRSRLSMTG